jgi:hypothetical protein
MKLRLIKICLNETCSKVRIGKHLSDTFPTPNGLKHGDILSPLRFKVALGRSRKNQMGLKLNGTRLLLLYADYVNLFEDNINTLKKTKKF